MKFAKTSARNPMNAAPIILSAFLLAFASSPARAQIYGVHFQGNNASTVTGTAGVVPVAGWNNIPGANATQTINSSDGLSAANLSLVTTGGAGLWRSGLALDGGNGSLMSGYIDDGNGQFSTATITGLTAGATFDIYVYFQGDAIRPGNGGDRLPNYTVNGTRLYTANEAPATPFTQAGTQTTNTTAVPPPVAYGDYIVFPGVVASGGQITVAAGTDTTSFRSPFNGFELVAVPEPSTLGFVAVGVGALALFARRRSRA